MDARLIPQNHQFSFSMMNKLNLREILKMNFPPTSSISSFEYKNEFAAVEIENPLDMRYFPTKSSIEKIARGSFKAERNGARSVQIPQLGRLSFTSSMLIRHAHYIREAKLMYATLKSTISKITPEVQTIFKTLEDLEYGQFILKKDSEAGEDLKVPELLSLAPKNWVYDAVIDSYFSQGRFKSAPNIIIGKSNDFMMLEFELADSESLSRLSSAVWQTLSCRDDVKLILPINTDCHWTAIEIRFQDKHVLHFDSLPDPSRTQYVFDKIRFLLRFLNLPLDRWIWSRGRCPSQKDGYSCGVVAINMIERTLLPQVPLWTAKTTDLHRIRIFLHILKFCGLWSEEIESCLNVVNLKLQECEKNSFLAKSPFGRLKKPKDLEVVLNMDDGMRIPTPQSQIVMVDERDAEQSSISSSNSDTCRRNTTPPPQILTCETSPASTVVSDRISSISISELMLAPIMRTMSSAVPISHGLDIAQENVDRNSMSEEAISPGLPPGGLTPQKNVELSDAMKCEQEALTINCVNCTGVPKHSQRLDTIDPSSIIDSQNDVLNIIGEVPSNSRKHVNWSLTDTEVNLSLASLSPIFDPINASAGNPRERGTCVDFNQSSRLRLLRIQRPKSNSKAVHKASQIDNIHELPEVEGKLTGANKVGDESFGNTGEVVNKKLRLQSAIRALKSCGKMFARIIKRGSKCSS
ncbi:hypothetical protein BKA69DRAFT_782674 [Paraphysoderma sedebokerense]|nr:hypothetical protein BKA69DRAFT_782674 [Paraphysoderma sedebokerense]